MLSPCLQYRFALSRCWSPNARVLGFIMLNPSTANDTIDDPTIRKLIQISKFRGYGGFLVANLFALRSSKPDNLRHHRDPIGPSNDYWIMQVIRWSELVVCAWGNHGTFKQRGKYVKSMVPSRKRYILGLNHGGQPTHPLFLSPSKRFIKWH